MMLVLTEELLICLLQFVSNKPNLEEKISNFVLFVESSIFLFNLILKGINQQKKRKFRISLQLWDNILVGFFFTNQIRKFNLFQLLKINVK